MHGTPLSTIPHSYTSIYGDAVAPPVLMLPPELLIEVFAFCVANEGLAPLTLREVCKWWHMLVDASPRLWQTIHLNDAYGTRLPQQQAVLWTTKSQPFKYDIELKVVDPQAILPLLSPLLSSIDRWRSFRMAGNNNDELLSPEFKLTPDTLTHLHLCLHDNDQDEWDDDESRITFSPISPDDISTYALNLWIAKLPSPRLLPSLHFVHVTIAEGGEGGLHTQPIEILEFLTACPELESFFLSGYIHNDPIYDLLPIVDLPNLITLHLKSTSFARAILSSLYTPRLQNLYLAHLNVDYELNSYYQEDGDSEDEAHDYSQSPSSDRATGMGLRALINRSHPPIRVLEMDFCDMRTKDFGYLFDRLPHLEEFHIVASDMSDKVIGLFRPYYSPAENAMMVRLPSLRKLKLTNCQRVSGIALVDEIGKRVQYTDRECPAHSLWEVSISGCDGFRTHDRFLLSAVLGNRLRS